MKPADTSSFTEKGYLRLESFHSRDRLAAIRQKVLGEIKALSGRRNVSTSIKKLPVFQQIGKLSALVKVPRLHEALVTTELIELVTNLGGRSPSATLETQLLLSPPNQGAWTFEGLNWHVDAAAEPHEPLPGIQIFFLVDDVSPRGGATLALAGSHRFSTRRSASPSLLRKALGTSVDLERNLADLDITVVEMSGRAGDVFLMDMRVLHTPSINTTRNLRMMATCRCMLGT